VFTRDASRPFDSSIMATPDSIAHVLASTLNPDSNVRIAAELNLSELLKSPRKLVWSLRVPYRLFSLDTSRRVCTLTCTTRALSGCRVLFATDESYLLSVHMGWFLMTLCLCSVLLALGDYHTQEVREGTLVSVFSTI
jgi:hypothetical protein